MATTKKTSTKKSSPRKVSSKKTPSKKKTTKKSAPAAAEGGRIPLKRICQKLDLDPKNARVRLRRAIRNGDLSFRDVDGSRWDLTKREAAQVEKILSE